MAPAACNSPMKISPWSALITGLVIGISAAALQAFFRVQTPEAFGIDLVAHPAIIVKWLMNNIWGTNLAIVQPFVLFPSLLAIGVLIGSHASARKHNELAWRATPARKRYMAVLFGFLVANFALMAGADLIRAGLLVSYGSVAAVILLASMIMGVLFASIYLRHRKEPLK